MDISGIKAERIFALSLLALIVLNPPFLQIFDGGTELTVFGIPPLYLYLYAAWAALIFLLCLASGSLRPKGKKRKRKTD